jgi:acyl-CoA synthetase (AMP-forming)/AMP-acid ligase II
VEIDVVTDGGAIAAHGEVGELVARGANISAGYWNNANGFRTGDLGYRDDEGFLYIVGRRHEMLKIGGQRIAPQEIEHVLQQHPAVSDVAVVGTADDLLGERPVAFLVLRDGMATDEAGLRRFCAAHLAPAKIPSRVVFSRDLPKLGAGKVDRQLLRRAAANECASSISFSGVSCFEA